MEKSTTATFKLYEKKMINENLEFSDIGIVDAKDLLSPRFKFGRIWAKNWTRIQIPLDTTFKNHAKEIKKWIKNNLHGQWDCYICSYNKKLVGYHHLVLGFENKSDAMSVKLKKFIQN